MADSTSAPALHTVTRKRFPRESCDPTKLPFVKDVKLSPRRKERKFWHVPKIDCYATANIVGIQYAADWIQYIKENPDMAGSAFMGQIAKEMYPPTSGKDESRGIAVGFWSLIEKALAHSTHDHYAMAEASAKHIHANMANQE